MSVGVVRKRDRVLEAAWDYHEKGAYHRAAKAYERALALDPSDHRTRRRLADVYARLGRRQDARRSYLEVVDAHERQGMTLMVVGALKALLALDPLDENAAVRLARAYSSLGMVADAASVLTGLAERKERLGKRDQAIEIRRALVVVAPDRLENRLQLAELLAAAARHSEAISEYEVILDQLRRERPGSDAFLRVAEELCQVPGQHQLPLMREMAVVHLSRGDTGSAERLLDVCQQREPDNIDTLRIFERLFAFTGRHDERRGVLEQISRVVVQANLGVVDTWPPNVLAERMMEPASLTPPPGVKAPPPGPPLPVPPAEEDSSEIMIPIDSESSSMEIHIDDSLFEGWDEDEEIPTVSSHDSGPAPPPPPEGARDEEVDNLLDDVETLLKFDVADRAIRVLEEVLRRSPGDQRALDLLKEARYRSGDGGTRSP